MFRFPKGLKGAHTLFYLNLRTSEKKLPSFLLNLFILLLQLKSN